jgi:hypothetical protein
MIGLDLVVEVSDVHFFDWEIGVEVFAEVIVHLWFFDPQVLIFEVFPVSRSFLMVKFSVVDEWIFLLHFLVPVGFALTIADLGLDKEILILEDGWFSFVWRIFFLGFACAGLGCRRV